MIRSQHVLLAALGVGASILVACTTCNCPPPAPPPDPTPDPTPDPIPDPVPHPTPHAVVAEKELMIRDLSVVNDPRTLGPDGAWSFGHLMKTLGGTANASRFVVDWLKTWESPQTVNGFTVPARPQIRSRVIDPWKARDGQAGVPDNQWQVNFANAPFRLLAIVNRMDLHRVDSNNVPQNAGEGRFVFGVLAPDGSSMPFTVIFEYKLVATNRERLRGWAQEWHALGTEPFGPGYNAKLQTITDKYITTLNQLRTNEISLDFAAGWELREFNLENGALKQVTVKQTPSTSFQGTPTLANFINTNAVELLDGTLIVPEQFNGQPLLGGASLMPRDFVWNATGIQNAETRHKMAFITCNGCHHKETDTGDFLHVKPRGPNDVAQLSGFLTGIQAADPVTGTPRPFNDLATRTDILQLLAEEPGNIRLQSLQQNRKMRVH